MQTIEHQGHINSLISHGDCQECRADCERQFLRPQWSEYRYVADYLAWTSLRLTALKLIKSDRRYEGQASARQWYQDFIKTLHRRITLKGAGEQGRKQCDSYLQRMGQFPRSMDSAYLRQFARRGASTLS